MQKGRALSSYYLFPVSPAEQLPCREVALLLDFKLKEPEGKQNGSLGCLSLQWHISRGWIPPAVLQSHKGQAYEREVMWLPDSPCPSHNA